MKPHLAILFAPDEADRQAAAQFSPGGLVTDAAFQARANDMQFGFAHRAFQTEYQTVVEQRWMIETVAVPDQSVRHAAEVQQPIPVCIVARQARDFQSEHNAHSAQGDFADHPCEAGAVGGTGAGDPEIFIDDGDLLWGPTQFASPVHQRVLPGRGLAIVLHLGRRGLANVDERGPLCVDRVDFAGISHVASPGCGYWPRRL